MSNNAIIAVILAKDEGNKKYSIMLGQVLYDSWASIQ